MEKELMMSVLGPLSIDPNMLNAQKQQVQVRGVWWARDVSSSWEREGCALSCEHCAVQGMFRDLMAPLPSPPNPAEPKLL